ncbi:thiamine-phosphate kinase [Parvularcula sp. LCG005]|uniref:thiamine-phosphate kinase n=1 Tax=Parvularcula sp. LCG005 TaxID=3078805 RepID=UPI00294372EE|nr:thiamine-phosphate kinase [Parvularcula sp. LCG005]WOI52422.1 thiamine-phosphate kinase [Parvularcula sp. LCG005]
MNEFDLIKTVFAPLAGEGSFGLTDDIAVTGAQVVSKDLLVAGVHFRREDPLDLVAQKALRTNISDIIAKGCQPAGYLLGLVWPREMGHADAQLFAEGLRRDQDLYGCTLLGGDTTRHEMAGAPLMISVTMMGTPLGAGPVLRTGAQPGDVLMVSGVIGDGWLGLQALTRGDHGNGAIDYYQCPTLSFGLQELVARVGTAALDVSDGLIADAEHLARQSGVGIEIDAAAVPLSDEGRAHVAANGEAGLVDLLTGGDDYQILFSVSPALAQNTVSEAGLHGLSVTAIGHCVDTDVGRVHVSGRSGRLPDIRKTGYRHF